MFSRIHRRLGTAGFAISIVALVAALGGGAYAASGGLSGKEKTEVKKIVQTEAKKLVKAGPPGAPGAPGPAGAPGAKGDSGAKGDPGVGITGANGKSVVIGATAPNCTSGGKTLEVEGSGKKSEVCDGEEGPEGSPWTAGGVLPPEATETGTWAVGSFAAPTEDSSQALVPISFGIPLAQPIQGGHMHYLNAAGKEVKFNATTFALEEVVSTACTGTAADPKATPGNFCLYTGVLKNGAGANISFTDLTGNKSLEESQITSFTTGTVFEIEASNGSHAITGIGTWAVTAPAAQ
jgi:hypothetical protein